MKNVKFLRTKLRPLNWRLFSDSTKNTNNTNDTKDKIQFKNANDLKSFGRKFSEDEVKKYLDPYGFMNTTELKEEEKIKIVAKESVTKNSTLTLKVNEEFAKKLEELEKIEDPKLKADEKCKIMPEEIGMKYKGKEPTRYGDWEVKGKCVDF